MNLEGNGVVVVEYGCCFDVAGGKGPVLKMRL
jgi:hypothetical protein